MLEHVKTAANTVLAFRAVGKVTDEDYTSILIPAVEEQIKSQGKARFVYVIGPEFEGFEAKAMLDDALFGLHHWRDFERIALVTNHDWIANTMRIFLPLMPAKTEIFHTNELTDAVAWAAA
ncbi:STAS/SEC14 domain-containing protein [Pararhodobacter sp.]|uniref:STAS/SEC14 domain-containing protein n=1 Tax=Pararhodobacter sp. TaxID=2127056 RepID=UPI002AFDE1F2|nr:STAS/SEC14 domain-containing protein [Pararhodobacter sp.]